MWSAVQEPDYQVVRKLGDIEVRQYAAYTVAEILVAGSVEEAANWAFPILAGYIFGKNKGDRTLAVTTPVTQVVAPLQFAMTAPVTQTPAPGGFVVQFVLPKGVTVDSAPEPTDPRVQLREMPAHDRGDPLYGVLVGVQLHRAPRHADGRVESGGAALVRRAGLFALQRTVDAVVPAAQRNLAVVAVMSTR
jgi:hypothetical protein